MKARVVFHIDRNDADALIMALNNIENLFKEIPPDEAAVYLVANGSAVRLFLKETAGRYTDRIAALFEANVHFLVCNNSLTHLGIKPEALIGSCRVIPAGIMEIIRLQSDGCAYVKP